MKTKKKVIIADQKDDNDSCSATVSRRNSNTDKNNQRTVLLKGPNIAERYAIKGPYDSFDASRQSSIPMDATLSNPSKSRKNRFAIKLKSGLDILD